MYTAIKAVIKWVMARDLKVKAIIAVAVAMAQGSSTVRTVEFLVILAAGSYTLAWTVFHAGRRYEAHKVNHPSTGVSSSGSSAAPTA